MILLNQCIIAQEEQGFLKLDGANVIDEWDRNDPDLIFWNSNSIAFGISLHTFDIINLPFEIWLNNEEINDQVDECISEWNSIGCLDLYLDDTFPSIPMGFTTNEMLFGNYTDVAGAATVFAVTEFAGEYSFEQYSSFSETTYDQTQINFNNTAEFDYYWSTDLNFSDGYYPFKVVLLHEMGHVLGLQHCTAGGDPVMYEYIDPSQTPRVLLQTPDEQGLQLLCTVVGIEDYITITSEYETCNVNQTACAAAPIMSF